MRHRLTWWGWVLSICGAVVIGWVTNVRGYGERITKLEVDGDNTKQGLVRIETKLDRVLERISLQHAPKAR